MVSDIITTIEQSSYHHPSTDVHDLLEILLQPHIQVILKLNIALLIQKMIEI
jgi:hypothetical protein